MPGADLLRTLGDDAVELSVHAQPGAGRSEIVGRHGDALKIRVAAPPEQGRANTALLALLAESFGLTSKQVVLVAGESSRTKRVRLDGVDPEAVAHRLEFLLEGSAGRARDGRRRGRGQPG